MLLSVFYMAATMLQSFRLRSFVSRIARQLNERVSTVFYTLPDTICGQWPDDPSRTRTHFNPFFLLSDTPEAAASSDLCANRRESRMVDILWQNGAHRGCIIEPSQTICINTWITFPTTPLNIPIKMNDTRYEAPIPDSIYMLVEAQFPLESTEQGSSGRSREQFMGFTDYSNTLFVEEFGQPLAWRVDSHFAFLLRTDKERLLQFIVGSFIAGNLSINNDLQLLRIQCKFLRELSAADTHPIPPFFQPWTWKEKPNRSSPSANTQRRMCSLSSPESLAIQSCVRST